MCEQGWCKREDKCSSDKTKFSTEENFQVKKYLFISLQVDQKKIYKVFLKNWYNFALGLEWS